MREYLWIYQKKVIPVTEESMITRLEKNDIQAACPGAVEEIRELCQEELLFDERITAHGIFIDKELLREVGGLNLRLPAKWEYELALRAAERNRVCMLPATACEVQTLAGNTSEDKRDVWDGFCVDAYVVGRYCEFLRNRNLFEMVVEAVINEGLAIESTEVVEQFLTDMLTHSERYYDYYDATQPILIFRGDSCCYDILNIFAGELAKALIQQGNCVEFYDAVTEDVKGLTRLLGKRFKASIGFQAWIFSAQRKDDSSNLMDRIGGPKYNFVFDHPVWMQEQLRYVPKRYYALTHDRNYVDFIKKFNPEVADAYLLPPGGRSLESTEDRERIYDVTFLGTYGDYRDKLAVIADCAPTVKFLAAKFLLYMKKFPNHTAEHAFQMALEHYHIELSRQEFLELFGEMKAVIQCIMYYYREKAVEQILQEGITLHVFGDSWRKSPFAKNVHLQQHEAVYGEDAIQVLQKSKISLNIMAWHKDGFTERIADSMLAGAVVVSDDSTQLRELFEMETLRFDLRKIEELPQILTDLLVDDNRRAHLARMAQEKAYTSATWAVRAGELLQIIEEESRNR